MFIGIVVLLAIQMTTYFLFAHRLLKGKLMNDWFQGLNHSSDSVFVRDFYVTDCNSGDHWTYYSHHLVNDPNEVKKRLGVKFVKFQDKKDFRWNNPEKDRYRLVYDTWVQYDVPWTLYGLFSSTQHEFLIVDKKYHYTREVKYRWILFFWIKTFELSRVP